MRIDRLAQIRHHPFANPAHQIKSRGGGNPKHSGHTDQGQKVAVDEGGIGARKSPIHHAARRDGEDER